MNLLYILSEFPPDFGGGIASVYSQLLPALVEDGHNVTVLLANSSRCDQPDYEWKGINVQHLRATYLSLATEQMRFWRSNAFLNTFLPTAWAAWLQCRDINSIDLVEVTDWALLFVPWLAHERNHPVVVSLHGSCGQVDWFTNPSTRHSEGAFVRFLEAALLPRADYLIANSDLNAHFWRDQFAIYPCVIPPAYSEFDSSPHLKTSNSRGLVIGRLQNWKGVQSLCSALRLLPEQQIDWIGADTPWHEGSLSTSEFLLRQYPDIIGRNLHLLGQQPPSSVQAFLHEAAFLCVPSLWDVFNVTVIEAMAIGVPVLCSIKAGASMLISHGKTGFLFDPTDSSQIASSIQAVMQLTYDERSRLAQQALRCAKAKTSSSLISQSYQNLYRNTLHGFKPRAAVNWLESIIYNHSDLQFLPGVGSGLASSLRRRRYHLKKAFSFKHP